MSPVEKALVVDADLSRAVYSVYWPHFAVLWKVSYTEITKSRYFRFA